MWMNSPPQPALRITCHLYTMLHVLLYYMNTMCLITPMHTANNKLAYVFSSSFPTNITILSGLAQKENLDQV